MFGLGFGEASICLLALGVEAEADFFLGCSDLGKDLGLGAGLVLAFVPLEEALGV